MRYIVTRAVVFVEILLSLFLWSVGDIDTASAYDSIGDFTNNPRCHINSINTDSRAPICVSKSYELTARIVLLIHHQRRPNHQGAVVELFVVVEGSFLPGMVDDNVPKVKFVQPALAKADVDARFRGTHSRDNDCGDMPKFRLLHGPCEAFAGGRWTHGPSSVTRRRSNPLGSPQ